MRIDGARRPSLHSTTSQSVTELVIHHSIITNDNLLSGGDSGWIYLHFALDFHLDRCARLQSHVGPARKHSDRRARDSSNSRSNPGTLATAGYRADYSSRGCTFGSCFNFCRGVAVLANRPFRIFHRRVLSARRVLDRTPPTLRYSRSDRSSR